MQAERKTKFLTRKSRLFVKIFFFLLHFLPMNLRSTYGILMTRKGSKGCKLGSAFTKRHLQMVLADGMRKIDDIVVVIHNSYFLTKPYVLQSAGYVRVP